MALAPTTLTQGSSITDATSYTTGAFAVTANKPILLQVSGRASDGTAVNTPTITGHGATWVLVATIFDAPVAIFVFRTMLTSNSASATVTIDFGTQTQLRATWSAVEWTDADTSGTNGSGAIVQSATNSVASATSLTVTLSAYSSTTNRPYAAYIRGQNTGTMDPETGWTQLASQNPSENHRLLVTWRDDTTDTTATATSTTAAQWIGIAIEVKAAATVFQSGPHAAVATGVGVRVLQTQLIRAASATGVAACLVQTIKLFAGTAIGIGAVTSSLVKLVNAAAVASGVATLSTQTRLILAGTALGVGALSKHVSKLLTGTATGLGVLGSLFVGAGSIPTLLARLFLRASQNTHRIELKLVGTPAREAFQSDAYQNEAFQLGGTEVFRSITLLHPARPE